MISKDKKYKTRDGREVMIYTTDAGGAWPVHGAVHHHDGYWLVAVWTSTGASNDSYRDLIEVKPRIQGWVNVYAPTVKGGEMRHGAYGVCLTRDEADRNADPHRIACIRIDCAEGDGL